MARNNPQMPAPGSWIFSPTNRRVEHVMGAVIATIPTDPGQDAAPRGLFLALAPDLYAEAKAALTDLRDLRATIRQERGETPRWLSKRIEALAEVVKKAELRAV